jgi:8-oxo-dGTP diphosphatase
MKDGPQGKLVAVRTLVLRDGQVLLVGHRSTSADRVWWMAPGGLVHAGEPAMDAAAREVKEETGLEVEIGGLIYWLEWIWEHSHCVELYFAGQVVGGELAIGNDLDELDQYPVYPKVLADLLREHLQHGFPEGAMYLGISQPDLPR